MKKLAVTYTYHEHFSSLEALESVAYFEVEDDVAADMLAVEKPFGFVAVKSPHQSHIAMIVYWIAAAHNHYILEGDKISDVTEE
jgi:hypothetical protein